MSHSRDPAPSGKSRAPASPFDDAAGDYDAWFEGEGSLVFEIELRALQEVLPSLPKPWLEVGVGSGRFAQQLGIETGIDPSIRLLEIATRRSVVILRGVGEQLPFAGRSVGTAFLIATLCFVDWPLSVLREVSRVLVPHGKMVLGVIPGEGPWGRRYEERKRQGHRLYQQASFRRYGEIVSLVERGGFVIEQIVSTLTQRPDEVKTIELPRSGFRPDAGFVVIVAGKRHGEG